MGGCRGGAPLPYSHSCGQLRPDQSHSCPGGLELEVEGQGLRAGFVRMEGGGASYQEAGARGCWELGSIVQYKPQEI